VNVRIAGDIVIDRPVGEVFDFVPDELSRRAHLDGAPTIWLAPSNAPVVT
jgi:hypothetical protein